MVHQTLDKDVSSQEDWIENKVRYVEVTRGGWDTHNDNFNAVANNCQDIDKALSGLLLDLEMRGLLKETMVVLTSEFGRTPNINGRDGRDHWPYCFYRIFSRWWNQRRRLLW